MTTYTQIWDSRESINGPHQVHAVIKDSLNNSFTTPVVSVTVGNVVPKLIAAYAFDENQGLVAVDGSGNSHVGTLDGPVWDAAGKYNSALMFDGVNDAVSVVGALDLGFVNGMTLEAWVYPTGALTGWKSVIVKEYVYYLYANSPTNVPACGFPGAPTVLGTAPLVLNQWTYLVVTYDKTNIKLYVNGVKVSSVATTVPIPVSTLPLRIGASNYGEFFPGKIDNVRIYDAALSESEVLANMTKPLQDKIPPVVSVVSASSTAQASVTWTTNESSDTQIEYGLTTAYGTSSPLNPALVTTHTVALIGLVVGAVYHYRVKSRDKAGNLTTSADGTFTT